MEPEFTQLIDQLFMSSSGFPVNGPVYLTKEDNVVSEQSFLVAIQVIDSGPPGTSIQPATIGDLDYRLVRGDQSSVTLSFPAYETRINVPFTLLADSVPEGTEAFQASISPVDTQMRLDGTIEIFPTFLSPHTLTSEIFVIIEDDDRKLKTLIAITF